MAKRHILHLTAEQEQELRDLRDNGDRAYLREHAAALLKKYHLHSEGDYFPYSLCRSRGSQCL